MSDVPFGFSASDPDNPDEGSGGEGNAGLPDPLAAMFGGSAADLGAALQQFGQLLSASPSGPVNWDLAKDTARKTLATESDPSVTSGERSSIVEAIRLADMWLDAATELSSAVTKAEAWSRAEWVEQTLPRWQELISTLAERVAAAQSESLPDQLPEQVRAMAGPLMGVMQQMSGVMFGMQVGQGLGALATEVVGSTDVGIPLAAEGLAVLLPTNITEFGNGLGVPADEVRLYLALRECAHIRLFHHAPWLRSRIVAAVDDYARGISIDMSGMESLIGELDPTNPQAFGELMQSGMFEPPTTPEQQAALTRLETLLALVEGWVDEVVFAAAKERLPGAASLREALQRRRAIGGPAEATFETLVGLQLRPRRLREAATFWRAVALQQNAAARDALWSHPDLLPNAEDLADPEAFAGSLLDPSLGFDLSALDSAPPAPKEPPAPGSDERSDPTT